ncbi:homoserine kinase [Neobacillus niacini]|uniref:homoserine kinase n=1 Tax=Neobacillus niacini TaxID=86668 RepID=UPI0021CB73B0|nr:homoserine kinase [Neobacillus niacini]MCM3765984.1 homoserine kinase [Neobacillus niacini]
MPLPNRVNITVPASTANLGPGFDSMGLALDLYLTLEAESSDRWEFFSDDEELKGLPTNDQHFIAQIAVKTAEQFDKVMPPCRVKMKSEIPLARGLGSSASAIVAGIELADTFADLRLTKQEKLLFATGIEGHPDNVGASLYGGLVVGCYNHKEVEMLSFSELEIETVAVIPKEILLTTDSRGVLPATFSRNDAVQASATANLLVAALLSKQWALAGKMMEQDLFHQPYRKPLIPFYQEIQQFAKENGAFGVALSGAGPTILCFTEKGQGECLSAKLQSAFPDMTAKTLNIDYVGSSVQEVEKCVK